jgi:hypothetical protein
MEEPIHSLLIAIQETIEEDMWQATDVFNESLGMDTDCCGFVPTLQDRWPCLRNLVASARFSNSYGLLVHFD